MGHGVARLSVTAAVAEGIELLDVAKIDARLLGDPGPEPAFERAVLEGRKRAGRQRILSAIAFIAHDEDDGLIVEHGHDRSIEADLYGRSVRAHLADPFRVVPLEALARDTPHIRVGYHGAILPSLDRLKRQAI